MVGELDEEAVKAKLEQNERMIHHFRQVLGVVETLYEVMIENIAAFVDTTDLTDEPARLLLQQYSRMVEFTVARLTEIKAANKLAVPQLRRSFFVLCS